MVVVDKILTEARSKDPDSCHTLLIFSSDEGKTWSDVVMTPARGIVPDRLLELSTGRWIVACHYDDTDFGNLVQRLWYSDDQGVTWSPPVTPMSARFVRRKRYP